MAHTKNMLEAFEQIAELAKDSKLDTDFQKKSVVKSAMFHASCIFQRCRRYCWLSSLTEVKTITYAYQN